MFVRRASSSSSREPRRSANTGACVRALLWFVVAMSAWDCSPARFWTVVSQAQPNPLLNQHRFVFTPFVFDAIDVDVSPAAWATHPVYQEGRGLLVERFGEMMARGHYEVTSLATPVAPAGSFVVRVLPLVIRFGRLSSVVGASNGTGGAQRGFVSASVQIFAPDGRLVDDVRLEMQTIAGDQPAVEMRYMGERLGAVLTQYLDMRTGLQIH